MPYLQKHNISDIQSRFVGSDVMVLPDAGHMRYVAVANTGKVSCSSYAFVNRNWHETSSLPSV